MRYVYQIFKFHFQLQFHLFYSVLPTNQSQAVCVSHGTVQHWEHDTHTRTTLDVTNISPALSDEEPMMLRLGSQLQGTVSFFLSNRHHSTLAPPLKPRPY